MPGPLSTEHGGHSSVLGSDNLVGTPFAKRAFKRAHLACQISGVNVA